jgi:hypothetical protein
MQNGTILHGNGQVLFKTFQMSMGEILDLVFAKNGTIKER